MKMESNEKLSIEVKVKEKNAFYAFVTLHLNVDVSVYVCRSFETLYYMCYVCMIITGT